MSASAPSIRLVGLSGSLRAQSYNSAALRAAASLLPQGMHFAIASLAELPFYNSDVEQRGMPAAVQSFRSEIAGADALIFAVPEYNFSIPGVLKNALEWLSRPPDPPANGKPCALFGASVSPLGTARGQFHFRHVCVSLNLIPVNTPHVDIASARDKFDPEGRLVDQPSLDQLRQLLIQLQNLTIRLRNGRPSTRS
jgi:chromate reductase, NAD(P)H dehydrogenase (quinone)